MNYIDKLIRAEKIKSESLMIYQLLGHFGDRLPTTVSEEMRNMADDKMAAFETIEKKVGKNLNPES